MTDEAGVFPNEDGAVKCLKCRKVDSIYRNGANRLLSATPKDGTTLYIHEKCLSGLESNQFITLYYDALTDATRGE